MKIKLISIFTAAVLLLSLCACGNGDAGASSDSENSISSEQESSIASETEESSVASEPGISSVVSKQDKSSATNSKSEAEKKLNLELLSDIGLTYSQLKEKRGEKVKVISESSGLAYYFNNGHGYFWDFDKLDYGRELMQGEAFPILKNKNGNVIIESAPLPKSKFPCILIFVKKAKDLFLGLERSANISEIENIRGVKCVEHGVAGGGGEFSGVYDFIFSYKDMRIYISSLEKEKVHPDSEATIQLLNSR